MSNPVVARLESVLAAGKDTALLRFGLGSEYLKLDATEMAIHHLHVAVHLDPDYSAAWKKLGQAHEQAGQPMMAMETYQHGITVAEARGDLQAAREMKVFLGRLQRGRPAS